MSSRWRLIVDGPVEGAINMACDRAVQLAREAGTVSPTLRLYRWAKPTVTLGRFQDIDSVDEAACAELGVDVVRRFTGGRGVLHDDELTYSVVASVEDGIPRGVAASYRVLSEALAEAYRRLGVDAALTERDRGSTSSGACYLATTRADLSLGATKLSGSAQVWHGATVLQHGSFTLSRDVSREARVFRLSSEEAARLGEKTTTILEATGARPAMSMVEEAVVAAFSDVLGVEFACEPLTQAELASCGTLASDVTVTQSG